MNILTKQSEVVGGRRPGAGTGLGFLAGRGVFGLVIGVLFQAGAGSITAQDLSGLERTQSISLSKGWNAVFVEVEPEDPDPSKVFAGVPVDKAATLFESPVTNQFVADAAIDLSRSSGWGIWYSADRPESFLKSLDEIQGNRGYLVHAKQDCDWKVTGTAMLTGIRWKADAYNFVGFPVKEQGGPTFGEFFGGSSAHAGQAIYRMVHGRWKKVLQPDLESMRSGEAFWIYCDGQTDYQGPVRVETPTRMGMVLGNQAAELVVRNATDHPVIPVIEHVPGPTPGVPLSIVVESFGDPDAPVRQVGVPMSGGKWSQSLPPLEPGAALAIPMQCRLPAMVRPLQSSLLRITTDFGTEFWVPVRGLRDDLNE